MLQVVFYNSENINKVANFQPLSFREAVTLTEQVEKEARQEKLQFSAQFQVTSDQGLVYYEGIFNFGSYDYQNIYHQLREMAPKLKVTKEKEREKKFLLEQIEVLTPAAYKEIEEIDKTFINLQKTNISKLKKWQRMLVYFTASASLVGCIGLGYFNYTQAQSYDKEIAAEIEKASIHESLIEQYEMALQGHKMELIPYLEELQVVNKMTESQERLLLSEYLMTGEFEKAVKINDDIIFLETLLLENRILTDAEKAEKIAAFNELYPTNEARYDLAYFEGSYDLMLNIENVNMTVKRSEMKTYALLKLHRVEDARRELNNNSNATLEEKIIRYEVLAAEKKTLQERLTFVTGSEADELKQKITEIDGEMNGL